MKKRRSLQMFNGSLSLQKQQQQPSVYLGNKTGKGYSAHGGMSYTKRNNSGCGCGSKVPKKAGLKTKK